VPAVWFGLGVLSPFNWELDCGKCLIYNTNTIIVQQSLTWRWVSHTGAHPHVRGCCTVIVLVLYKNQIPLDCWLDSLRSPYWTRIRTTTQSDLKYDYSQQLPPILLSEACSDNENFMSRKIWALAWTILKLLRVVLLSELCNLLQVINERAFSYKIFWNYLMPL